MSLEKNGFNNKNERVKFDSAALKFKNFGNLGVTAEDHRDLGGTPDKILFENPGKTLGQILSIDEIEKYIIEQIKVIDDALEDGSDVMVNYAKDTEFDLLASIHYLGSIGKLPVDLNYK